MASEDKPQLAPAPQLATPRPRAEHATMQEHCEKARRADERQRKQEHPQRTNLMGESQQLVTTAEPRVGANATKADASASLDANGAEQAVPDLAVSKQAKHINPFHPEIGGSKYRYAIYEVLLNATAEEGEEGLTAKELFSRIEILSATDPKLIRLKWVPKNHSLISMLSGLMKCHVDPSDDDHDSRYFKIVRTKPCRYKLDPDFNDEECFACGDLALGLGICCETCPATFHPGCHGYCNAEEAPDDWRCFFCRGEELELLDPNYFVGHLMLPSQLKTLSLKVNDGIRIAREPGKPQGTEVEFRKGVVHFILQCLSRSAANE